MSVVVVTSGFPRRSETFALNELLALDRAGMLAGFFATKVGDGTAQPGAERLARKVQVLAPGSPAAQADELARSLDGQPVAGVHGYFAHAPAEVARHAAARLGVPYGFSVHARDARKVTRAALHDRARRAACVVACNGDVAGDVRGAGADIHLIPHGVDLARFAPTPPPPAEPLELLAVGRLVEKKGFAVLLDAVALASAPWRLRVVGEGPLRPQLAQAILRHGLGGRVRLVGPLTHHELPAAYASAHAVAVPSIEDGSGDRDGLPNVLIEAMASGRPPVASAVGAIRAGVEDGVTGLLVPPGNARALAAALDRLAGSPALRAALGAAARLRAERDFDLHSCTGRFVRVLERTYG
jgi:glycosyltransferase involved in cell wall biosynthesis